MHLLSLCFSILDARCLPDSEYPFGCVHSIYFDTPLGSSYDEKINGDNLKRKIRVRWYDGTASGGCMPIFIELKNRIGASRRKIRALSSAPAEWLSNVSLDDTSLSCFLRERANEHDLPVPMNVMPTIHISYLRRRYVCPVSNSRVSVDWNIEAPRVNKNFFAHNMIRPLQTVVCEFKNIDGTFPPWIENLSDAGFRLGSFSKFGVCTEIVKEGVF